MLKVLVTGGCGFIGSNFIRYLFEREAAVQIYNIDCLTSAGNLLNLDGIRGSYHFWNYDIRDLHKMEHIFETFRPEVVVHFAAETHVDWSTVNPIIFPWTNVFGTANLLELSRRSGCVEKFILVSTDEVYGSLDSGFADESSPLCPSSPYSASKAGADHLALSYCKTFGLPVIVTRCTNNYGPNQHVEKFIPRMITHAIWGWDLPVYGTGVNIRDWLYVRDHCAALWQLSQQGTTGEIYNIGYGQSDISNNEIA